MGAIKDIVNGAKEVGNTVLFGLTAGAQATLEAARFISRNVVKFGAALVESPQQPPDLVMEYYTDRGFSYYDTVDVSGLCQAIGIIGLGSAAVVFAIPTGGTSALSLGTAGAVVGKGSTITTVGCTLGGTLEEVSPEYNLDCGSINAFIFVRYSQAPTIEIVPFCEGWA